MLINNESILKMTVSNIKYYNKGYFFSRETMRFFGDKMASFGAKTFEGVRVLYRKPTAYVKTPFSGTRQAGKDFFNCWIVEPVNEQEIKLKIANDDFKNRFYKTLNKYPQLVKF